MPHKRSSGYYCQTYKRYKGYTQWSDESVCYERLYERERERERGINNVCPVHWGERWHYLEHSWLIFFPFLELLNSCAKKKNNEREIQTDRDVPVTFFFSFLCLSVCPRLLLSSVVCAPASVSHLIAVLKKATSRHVFTIWFQFLWPVSPLVQHCFSYC